MNEHDKNLQWHLQHYQDAVNALENAKRRQWSIPYYILILYAAIIGFHEAIEPSGLSKAFDTSYYPVKIFLLLIAWITSLIGVLHVIDNHYAQSRYRKRQGQLRERYESAFEHEADLERSEGLTYYLTLPAFFILLIVAGFFCVLVYLKVDLFTLPQWLAIGIPVYVLALIILWAIKHSEYRHFARSLPSFKKEEKNK